MQKTSSLVIEWLGRNAASLGFEHHPSLSFVYFVFDGFCHRLFFFWFSPSLLSIIYLFLSLLWFIFSYTLPAFSLGCEIHVLGIWCRAVSTNVLKRNECSAFPAVCGGNAAATQIPVMFHVCHCVQCVTVPVSPSDPHPTHLDMVEDGHAWTKLISEVSLSILFFYFFLIYFFS